MKHALQQDGSCHVSMGLEEAASLMGKALMILDENGLDVIGAHLDHALQLLQDRMGGRSDATPGLLVQ